MWLGVHQYCIISTLNKDNVEDHKDIRVISKVFQTQSPKPMFAWYTSRDHKHDIKFLPKQFNQI